MILRKVHLGIKGKLIAILTGFSVLIVIVLGIITFQLSKSALEEQAFNQLKSIRETKKKDLQDYFKQIKDQVITLSEDLTITEFTEQLNTEFNYLDTAYSPTQLNEFRDQVNGFYKSSFIPKLNENLIKKVSPEAFVPQKNNSIVAQYLYISNNANPLGEKNSLNTANDGSKYSEIHKTIHPVINDYLKRFGYYDIFIINNEGDIVYSVYKEVDYATNLINGPYNKSNFAKVYKKALAANKSEDVAIEDFALYRPSYNAPASFIASPIFNDGKKVGVLAFQMPVDNINSIMTGDRNWKEDGLGLSGETYIVGSDFKMRSNSRFLVEDPENYYKALEESNTDQKSIDLIKHLNTSILLAPVKTHAAKMAFQNKTNEEVVNDYRSVAVLSAYSPLKIDGLNWAIFSEIDEAEAFAAIYHIRNLIFIIGLILAAIAVVVANIFTISFTKPIIQLKDTFGKLALGILPPPLVITRKDEIGETNTALNGMVESLHNAADFALEIGEGKFDSDFKSKSEEDTLGNALTQMRNRLSEVAIEEKKRSWTIEGLAIFSDILRQNNDDINVLSNNLISKMIGYLGANQGAIFVVNDDGQFEKNPVLDLTGCYAYDREKYSEQTVQRGEGLVGQCWIERKKIFLTNVPDNYISIRSGLGDAAPGVVLIVPLLVNDDLMGVIELAGFEVFKPHEIEFVEKVAESIASTLKSVKVNIRTKNLLDESKNQAEVLQQQEEEMRQNMEEMQATQEMFDTKEEEYKTEISDLKKQLRQLNQNNG